MPKPSEMKAAKWCITYWLTDDRTLETLQTLVDNMPSNWHLEGQIEQGHSTDDKLHAQLFLKTEHTRGTKVAKHFPNCYLDTAQNPFALKNYVHKKDTRIAEFKTVENRSPQWREVRKVFFKWYATTYPNQVTFGITDEDKMVYWDRFIGISLEDGMEIDLIGVNPQYRSCIMRYWHNALRMALSEIQPPSIDKQTDRQDLHPPSPGGGGSGVKKVKIRVAP